MFLNYQLLMAVQILASTFVSGCDEHHNDTYKCLFVLYMEVSVILILLIVTFIVNLVLNKYNGNF